MSDTPKQYAGLSFDDLLHDIVCTHLAEWGISDRDDRISGRPARHVLNEVCSDLIDELRTVVLPRIAELERKAARWDECERRVVLADVDPTFEEYAIVFGESKHVRRGERTRQIERERFAAAIDAAIEARVKETPPMPDPTHDAIREAFERRRGKITRRRWRGSKPTFQNSKGATLENCTG